MGNQGLLLALKDLPLAACARRHHSLVFTAPDVSRDDFRALVKHFDFDGVVALYCNDFDWALKASSLWRGRWFGRWFGQAGARASASPSRWCCLVDRCPSTLCMWAATGAAGMTRVTLTCATRLG